MDYMPSRFMRRTLLPDERCIAEAHLPWVYTLQAWLVFGFCLLLGYGIHYLSFRYIGSYSLYPVYAGAAVGFWLLAAMMMKKWTTEIVLTTQRLIHKRGFFMVKVEEVDIEQLASDIVDQSLLGRIFGYGEIHVRCIEANDIDLPPINNPYEFRNALEQQKHQYREHYMKNQRLRQRSVNSDSEKS